MLFQSDIHGSKFDVNFNKTCVFNFKTRKKISFQRVIFKYNDTFLQIFLYLYWWNFYFKEILLPGRLYRSNQIFDSMDLSQIEGLHLYQKNEIYFYEARIYIVTSVEFRFLFHSFLCIFCSHSFTFYSIVVYIRLCKSTKNEFAYFN